MGRSRDDRPIRPVKIYVYELVPVGEPDEETGEYSRVRGARCDSRRREPHRRPERQGRHLVARARGRAARPSTTSSRGRVGDLVTGTVLQGTPDFTIIKIREGVEAELPALRRSSATRASATSARPTSTTATTSASRRSSSRCATPTPDAPQTPAASRRVPADRRLRAPTPTSSAAFSRSRCRRYTRASWRSSPIAREPGARSKVAVFIPRGQPRSGRRLRRAEGLPRPHGGRGAAQRARRRHPVEPRTRRSTYPTPFRRRRSRRVTIDEDNNYATVIVPDDQLSLAIGKEGQNARLAARLTGWHIDIKPAVASQGEPSVVDDEHAHRRGSAR